MWLFLENVKFFRCVIDVCVSVCTQVCRQPCSNPSCRWGQSLSVLTGLQDVFGGESFFCFSS